MMIFPGHSVVTYILTVVNRDKFDHFAFDSPEYTPFYNDPRVLVGNQNVFSVANCSKLDKDIYHIYLL
jgi:hypothetical protein